MAGNTYKKETKKPKSKGQKKPFKVDFKIKFLEDPRFIIVSGLFLMITAVCFLLAFTSYVFSGLEDQRVYELISKEGWRAAGPQASNVLGSLGVWLSYLFVFKWFGVASYVFVPILFVLGYKITFKKDVGFFKPMLKVSAFALFWLSVVLGYIAVNSSDSALVYYSGGFGFEFADMLNSVARWATALFLLFFLAVFVIYFFDIRSLVRPQGILVDEEEGADEEEATSSTGPFNKDQDAGLVVEPVTGATLEKETKIEPIEKKVEQEEEPISPALDLTSEAADPIVATTPEPTGLTLDVEVPEEKEETKPEVEPKAEEEEPDFELVEKVQEKTVSQVENLDSYDPTLDLPKYMYPSLDLLNSYDESTVKVTREELEANKDRIVNTLANYKIGISSIKATIGPTVTLYEIVPEAGVKISKIKNLEDDIALSLAALGIRIIAPIPGKGTIGIEVPNKNREMVSSRTAFSNEKFASGDHALPISFGKTISNEVFVIDLAKMPHILMAGATGQGKSVGLNIIIASLLYKKHPSQLKFVLVDPKKVELSIFSKIERHFLAMLPDGEEAIITDTKKVIHTLNSLCIEMDNRYDLLKEAGCRNLKEYNKKFTDRKLNPEKGHSFMPYIVLVIDELADLMMTAGKEVETPIARLAQLARAVGIHLVVATQRPSVNVITGIIKANFPARISFKVTSKIDSRTILDAGGADQLVGMGDMLFSQGSEIIRVQCAFIDTPEVDAMVDFIGEQQGYDSAFMLPEYVGESGEDQSSDIDLSDRDVMFEEAARTIVSHQQGSTSLLQRKLKLGYNRAGRLIDQLEAAGIVGPFGGSKARDVLIKDEYSLEQLLNELNGIQRD